MLPDYVNNKLKGKRLVFVWDDIQRVKNADLVGICVVLFEHTDSCIILCGLKEGITQLENEVSFLNRGMQRLEPEMLTTEDLKELIKKRVEWVGGEGYKPFTEEAVKYLATRFNGARDLLNICSDIYTQLEREYSSGNGTNIPVADMTYIEDMLKERLKTAPANPEAIKTEDIREKLSGLETQIFDALIKNESKTSPQLVEELKKTAGQLQRQ